jgi:hypothetical protein
LKRQIINAVFEEDLEKLLNTSGLLGEIEKEQIKCCACGKTITVSNIKYIFRRGDNVYFCCDQGSCAEKALAMEGD